MTLTDQIKTEVKEKFKKKFLEKVSDFDPEPGVGVSPDSYAWSDRDEGLVAFLDSTIDSTVERVVGEILKMIEEERKNAFPYDEDGPVVNLQKEISKLLPKDSKETI